MVVVVLVVLAVDQSQAQGIFGNFFANFFSNLNNPQRNRPTSTVNRATTVSSSRSSSFSTPSIPLIQTTTEIVELVSTTTEFSFVTETVFQDVVS